MQYTLVRSRRKTLSVRIRDGEVTVKAPLKMPVREIEGFLAQKQDWIADCLAKYRQAQEQAGEKLTPEQLETLKVLAETQIRKSVCRYAPLLGVTYGRITVRCQKTRWGSCTAEGNLNFNALLYLAPPRVLDSVVVHELCHRKQMNHSEAFYREVLSVMPDYREVHRWLKENGQALLLRLP